MTAHRPIALQDALHAAQSRPEPAMPVAGRSLAARVGAALRRGFDAWVEARAAAATARTLARLNDRQLRDIGVERAAIPEIARGVAMAHLAVAGLDGRGSEPFDPRRIRP